MIYIDDNFHCYTENPNGTYREFHVSFFDGKCKKFVEGYMYVPNGETHTLDDGVTLLGELIAPWKPYDELEAAQHQYEREKLADAEAALAILLGGVV